MATTTFKPGMKVFWAGEDGFSNIPATVTRVFKSTVTLTVNNNGEIQTVKGVAFDDIEPAKAKKKEPIDSVIDSKPVNENENVQTITNEEKEMLVLSNVEGTADVTTKNLPEWKKFDDFKDEIFSAQTKTTVLIKLSEIYPKPEIENDSFNDMALNLQPRFVLNDESIERYANRLEVSEAPPVLLMKIDDKYVLIDGYHRREAYLQAGRQEIPAIVETGDFDEAFYKALTANLNNALPLDKREVELACKAFIKKIPSFSEQTIQRILDDVFYKTGKKYKQHKGERITDTIIGDIFGYSSRHIKNFRDEIEQEEKLAEFELKFHIGDRVFMKSCRQNKNLQKALDCLTYQEQIGTIERIYSNLTVWIKPFSTRLQSIGAILTFEFDEILECNLKFEEPNFVPFSVGDRVRHWLGDWGCGGTVVSFKENSRIWSNSAKDISPEYPLIFLDNGEHTCIDYFLLEPLGGNVTPPSIEERIEGLKQQIGKIVGEGAMADWQHSVYDAQIKTLENKKPKEISDGNFVKELKSKSQNKSQVFPDVEKYSEDPESCSVTVLEPPVQMPKSIETKKLEDARLEIAEKNYLVHAEPLVRSAIETLKKHSSVLSDKDIDDLIEMLTLIKSERN